MDLTAKRLDNLKLFIFDTPKPKKIHRYNLLEVYKWMFGLESALGIRRISISDDVIRPTSVLFRLYCLAITCALSYHTYCNINRLLNKPDIAEIYNSVDDLIWHVLSVVVLVKTVFLDGKITVELFETFDEIDEQLNLLEDDHIYKMSRFRNGVVLCFLCFGYVILGGIWLTDGGFFTLFRVHMILLIVLSELQLVLCACFLSDVQFRLRNLKGQLVKRFSLQNITERKKTRFMSIFCLSYEVGGQEIKVPIELKNFVKVYGKIMKAFDLTNRLFSIQVLLYFSIYFLSMLLSIYGSIILLGLQIFSLVMFMGSIGWWQRMMLAIFIPCYICEDIIKDVDKFKSALLSLLGEARHEEHHPAAADLLRYCDVSEPRFSVYGLFYMNISLPFSFLQLVATHVIILLQLYL